MDTSTQGFGKDLSAFKTLSRKMPNDHSCMYEYFPWSIWGDPHVFVMGITN